MKYLENNGVTVMANTEMEALDYKNKGFREVDEEGNPIGGVQSATEIEALKTVEALKAENEALKAEIAALQKPAK
jgi:hypothetical protein